MHRVLIESKLDPAVEKQLRVVVQRKLADEMFEQPVMVSLVVVDKRVMADLNERFHGEAGATDVLSFPFLDAASNEMPDFVESPDEPQTLGEIVVCLPVAEKQATEKEVSVAEELAFLVDHGMEHLLGRHHE